MAHELLKMEREAWRALASPASATAFYKEHLADEVLMLFPGGIVIDSREKVIDSMQQAGWREFTIEDEHILDLTDGSAVVAYKASATSDDRDYTALCNSTYVKQDGQ